MIGPHATTVHGRYTYEWGDPERAILELDYLRTDRGEVTAEVSVTSTVPTGGLVHVARVNLLSTRSLSEFAGHVSKRTPGIPTDWQQVLSVAARDTVVKLRRGEPAVLLRDVPRAEDDGQILPPLAVARMPSILFGDGGAAKSMLALAAAASIQTGHPYLDLHPSIVANVGYLDWEMDGHEHRSRLERLVGDGNGPMPGIVYIPCSRPLADDVDRIRREIIHHELGYLIVDSVALACDGPPEAAEVAIRFFGALRELKLGALLVAHVNRAGDTERPFGSAFWHNGARLTWYAKLEADIGGSTTVGLFCKKANTGPRAAPLGYQIDWSPGSIAIARTDVRDIPDISKHVPLTYRIIDTIRTGALTIVEIAERTSAEVETVARTLRRMRDRGQANDVAGPDGVMRWGLSIKVAG
jgi:hypothetical protein